MKNALTVIHPHAAGIDIGSKSFFVDAGEEQIQIFPTYTEGCYGVRDYLLKHKISTVAIAIKAIARKLACYYYRVMTKGEEFLEIGIAAYEQPAAQQTAKVFRTNGFKTKPAIDPSNGRVSLGWKWKARS